MVGDWNLPNEVWEEVNKETALDLGHLTQFASHAYRTAFGEKEARSVGQQMNLTSLWRLWY